MAHGSAMISPSMVFFVSPLEKPKWYGPDLAFGAQLVQLVQYGMGTFLDEEEHMTRPSTKQRISMQMCGPQFWCQLEGPDSKNQHCKNHFPNFK